MSAVRYVSPAEKDVWHLLGPIFGCCHGSERILQCSVKALNKSICLWVECGCSDLLDSQPFYQAVEEVRFELTALVGDYPLRDSKSCDPMVDEMVDNGFSCYGSQRKRFRPVCVPIDHGEDVTETIRVWQRTYNVYVNCVESAAVGKDKTGGLTCLVILLF